MTLTLTALVFLLFENSQGRYVRIVAGGKQNHTLLIFVHVVISCVVSWRPNKLRESDSERTKLQVVPRGRWIYSSLLTLAVFMTQTGTSEPKRINSFYIRRTED